MRNVYFLLVAIFFCLLFACNKGGNTTPNSSQKSMLVGTWHLQQEHFVQYLNAAKKTDTIVNASGNNISKTQFNADGTFISSALYRSGDSGSLSTGISVAVDTARGTYTFTGTSFDTSVPVAGFAAAFNTSFSVLTGDIPVITLVSHSVAINKLTSTNLNIHSEYIFTYTTSSSGAQTYKDVGDYNYTR